MPFSAAALAFLAVSNFHVWINGKEAPVRGFDRGAFVLQPSSLATNSAEIQTDLDVWRVDVRPLSVNVKPEIANHHRISLHDLRPGAYTLEFNGNWTYVLHVFIQPAEAKAVDEHDKAVVYFGPGVHDAGAIELKTGQTLYLAPGAWVKGSVHTSGTRNVSIRGRGVLDASETSAKNKAIEFQNTSGALIEGITVFNSQSWTVVMRDSNHVRIRDLNVLNTKEGADGIDLVSSSDVNVEHVFVRANDDCVVVKAPGARDVQNVTVKRSVFWNMPWGNALEIGFELAADKVQHIRFENIDIIRVEHGAALSIHNGDRAAVSDVSYDNIRIENAQQKLIDLAIFYTQYSTDRPPDPEERKKQYDHGPWDGVLQAPAAERSQHAARRGSIRDVRFHNIQVVDGGLPFSVLAGYDRQHAVEHVRFESLSFCGRVLQDASTARLVMENARDVVF